jgi:spermidine synthase
MRLAKPNDLELSYTRSMMAFLIFARAPQRVLMIGLGGGSLAKFIYHRLPDAHVTAVEVNPQVVAIARHYFHVPADDERFNVLTGDGSEYVERVDVSADTLIVDGYDADAHAEELASRSFYVACRERLAPGGIFVVNLWGGDKLFKTLLKRIESAFPGGVLCLPAERPGNIIVFAFRDAPEPFEWTTLEARAVALEKALGLEFTRFAEHLRTMNRHDEKVLYSEPG